MSSTIKSWIDVFFSGKHRPVWLGNIDTDMKRGHGEPQLINLVNAGCRQAGPKILFDLSSRRSDCCHTLRDELSVSRVQTASSRSNLECPPGVNLKAGNIPKTYNDITKLIIQGRISGAERSVMRRMRGSRLTAQYATLLRPTKLIGVKARRNELACEGN